MGHEISDGLLSGELRLIKSCWCGGSRLVLLRARGEETIMIDDGWRKGKQWLSCCNYGGLSRSCMLVVVAALPPWRGRKDEGHGCCLGWAGEWLLQGGAALGDCVLHGEGDESYEWEVVCFCLSMTGKGGEGLVNCVAGFSYGESGESGRRPR
ncbi:hypothetical protein NC651_026802 [Populus alba x Populus x berolinensis]|nr:hypothetical protein NC651_026802 [Populus alba x Populus x berolinensis]